jgi:hypothetical protein
MSMQPLTEKELKALTEGVRQARNGQFASDKDVIRVFKKWTVDVTKDRTRQSR